MDHSRFWFSRARRSRIQSLIVCWGQPRPSPPGRSQPCPTVHPSEPSVDSGASWGLSEGGCMYARQPTKDHQKRHFGKRG